MVSYTIQITKPAEDDLVEIVHYFSVELLLPDKAQRILARFDNAIKKLKSMPYRNALVGDKYLAQKGIRMLLVDSYVVFYIIEDAIKTVTIIRVLYNKRDWHSLL